MLSFKFLVPTRMLCVFYNFQSLLFKLFFFVYEIDRVLYLLFIRIFLVLPEHFVVSPVAVFVCLVLITKLSLVKCLYSN